VTCLREIIFTLVCVLPRPDAPEPMHFGYGKAVNRAVIAASFIPQTPDIGPVIAMKPEPVQKQPQQRRGERSGEGLAVLAYAPARASGKQFEAISRGAFQVAHSRVDTSCFPKRLVGIIRDAERHFGGRAIINSGYRSKSYNRRVGGVRGSAHMRCLAADMRIPGVSKTSLRAFLMKHPKRGGVGIYCSEPIHIDVSSRRDWDWRTKRCRR
jgi:uncharacterized protein YcbK (DUF882 family)